MSKEATAPKCRNCDGECQNCNLKTEYDDLLKKHKEDMQSGARTLVWILLGGATLAVLFFYG